MPKKYIQIEEEVLVRLVEGKYVEGSLHRDKWTGQITFRAYNRQSRKRKKDKLIRYLEHGWVKESTKNLKYYESIPKKIGMAGGGQWRGVFCIIFFLIQKIMEALVTIVEVGAYSGAPVSEAGRNCRVFQESRSY